LGAALGRVAALAAGLLLLIPAPAAAHGPVNPEASDYLARALSVPAGLSVRPVDGDLRMWLRVHTPRTVVVLDYQGIPYLRFTPAGTQVNQRSAMYYLNQIPPEVPPTTVERGARPQWHRISRGESYEWHDGRLHALAAALAAPAARVLGRWRIPLRIDGRPAAIVGVLDRAPPPSLAWLWPVAVVLLSVPALRRLRDGVLERRVGHWLAWATLLGALILDVGEALHGRPGLSAGRLVVFAGELAVSGWAATRLVRRRDGPWLRAAIALLGLYRGLAGIAVLFRGYVLLALPTALARGAVAACLATGSGLALLAVLELAARSTPGPALATPG
jgi:hypothetical protein